MKGKNCLKCGSEVELVAEDLSDGESTHCQIFTCGNCGAKNSWFCNSGQGEQ